MKVHVCVYFFLIHIATPTGHSRKLRIGGKVKKNFTKVNVTELNRRNIQDESKK